MFDIFDSPILYRRVPSLFEVARAMQRQRMLEDLWLSDFDVPEMYFYFTSNGSKANKKNKKTRAEKRLAKSQKEQEAKSEESPKEEIPAKEEEKPVEDKKQEEAPKAPEEAVIPSNESATPIETEKTDIEALKVEETKEEVEAPKSEEKPEEVPEPMKISPSFSEELPKLEETPVLEEAKVEPESSIKQSKSEELPKLEEKEVIEQKPKEVIPARPEEDDDEFTCETRTITKKGGFKHVIRTERNENTGIIIVTETREIGDKSMSLKRVMYPDGEVEEFESKKNLTDADLEEFKANWIKAFPVE
ncbi:hypothetical protein TVAG_050340 [Trichomonas vaginalis G3]|uniref:Uncharacterized protein n=1 Tax=Trichomonas vaginalis (strain ATCC PRA-98 / G3) TaxID=412133 RepID=A2EJG2_TRIV3|nr:myeloid leukemia factor family [Trichomonas vaginalis G3]EAY07219.1 hypothetical protein TVAG_050340 [Trichomonas vaginalis G3]KAI5533907.1 myeloid leukemia factor family [Trichomonas vaginalis G3]|eukprot:XP_001319442.1 hypothetical protein [Trichomonas vaginalis G3]